MVTGSFGQNLGESLLYILAVLLQGLSLWDQVSQLMACGSENWISLQSLQHLALCPNEAGPSFMERIT